MQAQLFFRNMGCLISAMRPAFILGSLALAGILWMAGCGKGDSSTAVFTGDPPALRFETTGEEFLISALNEIDEITEFMLRGGYSKAGGGASKANSGGEPGVHSRRLPSPSIPSSRLPEPSNSF